MELAKEGNFQIRYSTSLNRIKTERERLIKRIINKIRNNKIITTVVISFIMFSTINGIMIYNFMKILQKI